MRIEDKIKQKKFRNEYHRLLANLSYNYAHIISGHQRLLKPFGISFPQFNVLSILRGQHPNSASVSLIKERMLDQSSDVSRIIDRLVLKKLVTRNTCPNDRRQCDIMISENGLEVLSKLDEITCQFDGLVSMLNEEEAKTLNDLMDKLRK